jgi:DNA-binding beta-propeller fold protein YncE
MSEPFVPRDVTAANVREQMAVCADTSTRRGLTELARTEDLAIDPSGRRIAIAAYELDAIGIVDIEIDRSESSIRFGELRRVSAAGLERPHGLVFVDDTTLVVANREAEVILLELGDDGATTARSRVVLDHRSQPPVRSPGSLCAQWIADDLLEVMTCNNYVHDVTRHVLDRSSDWAVVDGEVLLRRGLAVPDGIAIERRGGWLAVSNHLKNQVCLYRYDEELGPDREPDGVLNGPNFAHGLAFTPDGRHLVVADAGLPYVHTYSSDDGDWSGERSPSRITRVMDDETFNLGRYNHQEGGPKGIVVTPTGAVVVTSEFQTACFDIDDIVGRPVSSVAGDDAPVPTAGGSLDGWSRVARARAARSRTTNRVTRAGRARRRVGRGVAGGVRWSGRRLLRVLPLRAREQTMHVADEVASFIRDDAL